MFLWKSPNERKARADFCGIFFPTENWCHHNRSSFYVPSPGLIFQTSPVFCRCVIPGARHVLWRHATELAGEEEGCRQSGCLRVLNLFSCIVGTMNRWSPNGLLLITHLFCLPNWEECHMRRKQCFFTYSSSRILRDVLWQTITACFNLN